MSLEDSTFSVSVSRDCFEVSASVVLGKVDFSLACVSGIPRLYWMASSLDTGQVWTIQYQISIYGPGLKEDFTNIIPADIYVHVQV